MNQDQIIRSIVRIHSYGRAVNFQKPYRIEDKNKSVGTGSFIRAPQQSDQSLYVLTCAHCVDSADNVAVLLPFLSQVEIPATVVSFVPQYDLAVLHVPDTDGTLKDKISYFEIGVSDNLKLGEHVVAVGFPLGQTALKVSDGVYAGFQDALQITAPISPGCSGGCLLNDRNEIIGVNNSGIVSPEANNIGYAVPIECYLNQRDRMFSIPIGIPSPARVLHLPSFGFFFHEATSAQITYATGDAECCKTGVYISKVLVDSPAAVAGIQAGDILCAFDDVVINNTGEVKVPWNYQNIQLEHVLKRAVEPREYTLKVWSQGDCSEKRIQPQNIMTNGNRELYSPYDPIRYVAFMGVCFMEFAPNHLSVPSLIKTYCKLYAIMKAETLQQPHVIIVQIFNGTQAQVTNILHEGDIVKEINGHPVSTLEEVRQHFKTPVMRNGDGTKMLSIKNDSDAVFMMSANDVVVEERKSLQFAPIYASETEIINLYS